MKTVRQHERGIVKLGVTAVDKMRMKMPMAQRAKQFMPFSALKGLSEALADRLKIKVPKREVAEDRAEELDYTLRCLECGNIIKVIYYDDVENAYITKEGMVSKVDEVFRFLTIVDTKIPFSEVFDIERFDEM